MSSNLQNVVTRFAPSPTGFLHIGGARTALFNWLFAKRHGGRFLLRIEDTDRKRSTDEAIEAIIQGMKWLGLDWDGDAVSQFSRADRHAEVAQDLLARGHAYKCFASPEEIQAAREQARSDGRNFLGDLWRDRDPSEGGDTPYSIRMKMPRDGKSTIDDDVQGSVTQPNNNLDDMILLRSDGTPTYMLSVVVDDHDMGISHVIRGDDHLNNAFKQLQIYNALDWDVPSFSHIPLIHGPDGKKLSKRHGALGVEAYEEMGFLAEAMRNYLLRLGWSHGDDEIISTEQAADWFNLAGISKGPARFDFDKLDSLNSHYIKESDNSGLVAAISPALEAELKRAISASERERLLLAMTSMKDRAKRLPDFVESAYLFCDVRPLSMSDKAQAQLNDANVETLQKLLASFDQVKTWSRENIKEAIANFCEAEGLKMGKVMQPLRMAVTGGRPSGDLAEILEILGSEETILRVKDCSVS